MSRSCKYCGGYGKLILNPYTEDRWFVCPRCQGTGSGGKPSSLGSVPLNPSGKNSKSAKFYRKYFMKPCGYCDKPMINPTRDHAHIPKHKGGTLSKGNMVVCCRSCNSDKGALTLQQWYERLLKRKDERAIFVERIIFRGNDEEPIHSNG